MIGHAHGAAGFGAANGGRLLGVGARLAVGNIAKGRPGRLLEGGALRSERQVKPAAPGGKILRQLLRGTLQQRCGRRADSLAAEAERRNGAVGLLDC